MTAIEINGKKVEAKPGEMLLAVLRRSGVRVPTLCSMEGLAPTGSCRLCVVEIEGEHRLVPSCARPVVDGMKVRSHSPRAVAARRVIVELLLANHPDDCLYCVRNRTCALQGLSAELGVRRRVDPGPKPPRAIDSSSPAIVREPAKCALCGRCVRTCQEIQGVGAIDFIGRGSPAIVGTAFDQGLNVSSCVNCGQCILVCPTGALSERSHLRPVIDALDDPDRTVVVQYSPAVTVTLAEVFGSKPGVDVQGTLAAALRRIGFHRVFDTAFSADLTVMEEASELARRLDGCGPLPMMTSCSPAWVKLVEQAYPDMIPNLSTCKSPQQMMGALLKTRFAETEGLDPKRIYSVAIMPCTAKKFEARRPEMGRHGISDVDAVLTTREIAQLIRLKGLDLATLEPEAPDAPFGDRSTAGRLFGATGGVTEAVLRTAHYLMTGTEMAAPKIQAFRGLAGVKEARVPIGGREIAAVVVSGLGNAGRLIDEVRSGKKKADFIEVMSCPGGCVGGGGQPIGSSLEAVRGRMQALYAIDREGPVRVAHENRAVRDLYRDYLGRPLGEKSRELLHTSYIERSVVR